MPEIIIRSQKHTEFIDITENVRKLIPRGMEDGICNISSTHTTAGLTINENADPNVLADIIGQLDKMVPWNNNYRHCEGNSAAHIKTSMMGVSQNIQVQDGNLCLGTWQGIFFCEFDGPRTRCVKLVFLSGKT